MGYDTYWDGDIVNSVEINTLTTSAEFVEALNSGYYEPVTLDGENLEIDWEATRAYYFIDDERRAQKLCDRLAEFGIAVNGNLFWDGEESWDMGVVRIVNNQIQVKPITVVFAEWEGPIPDPPTPPKPSSPVVQAVRKALVKAAKR